MSGETDLARLIGSMQPVVRDVALKLLRAGLPAAETMARLLELDAGRDVRQVHMIDAQGRGIAHTGGSCV